SRADNLERDLRKFIIEKHKKYSQAFACIVMFLIGAPLGSIIKKGGLGVPVIVAIMFFLLYYIIGIICEKSAKEGVMDPMWSVWVADLVLLPVGLFFLRQARIDAKLFDTDFYNVWIDRLKIRFTKSPK
ncbi:MAG: lipopolysaccharide export system permease protein, partial [Marinoscillum sp.]